MKETFKDVQIDMRKFSHAMSLFLGSLLGCILGSLIGTGSIVFFFGGNFGSTYVTYFTGELLGMLLVYFYLIHFILGLQQL